MRHLWRSVPVLGIALAALAAPELSAQPPDGTYQGTTDQGRAVSVTVSGGQITSWSLSYQCSFLSVTKTVNETCAIVGNSFNCGSTFCAPFVSTARLLGTFSGTSVSGTFAVQHQPDQFSGCCTLSSRTWSASLPGPCEPAAALACGAAANGSNGGAGSTDQVPSYSCNAWSYGGPEYAYSFQPASDDHVTVLLSGLADDLDLLVLQDSGSGCDPAACIGDSSNIGTTDESVALDVVGGATYYVVVDGFNGATSDYSIQLLCSEVFADGFESGDVSAWSSNAP
jgi:hypothetical protein